VNPVARHLLERARILVEELLARLIATDDVAADGLSALEGRLIAVHLRQPELHFCLAPEAGRLCLLAQAPRPPDVEVVTTPSGLVAMLRARAAGLPVPPGSVELKGDLAVAQRLQKWLGGLDVDFEELLAGWLGDVPAHAAVRGIRATGAGLRRAGEAGFRAAADYAVNEGDLLVGRAEMQEFLDAVDTLRERQERLAARLERLLSGRDLPAGRG
jgi:ubiquinone biosynthesis protein UbiJ